MNNFSVKQLKEAMVDLYNKKDRTSAMAYRIAFDLLESKIGEDKMDQFLDSYGM